MQLGVPPTAFVIVVAANLFPYKGHDDLLAALGQVGGGLGPDWRLLVIGADKGFGPQLAAQTARLGIGQHILWLGERKDVDDLFHAADVGVLPSHEEGFSNSLIEKMAHGLPVVATAVGGNIDAIVNEESGLLVPVKEPSALGDALLRLYNEPALRRRLGSAARLRVGQLFSVDRCVSSYLQLYQNLHRRRKGAVSGFVDEANSPLLVELSDSKLTAHRSAQKIMIVTTDLRTGGAETMLVRLVASEQRLAQHVTVVNLLKGNHYSRQLEQAGIKVVECEIGRYRHIFGALLRVARTIREDRPDIVQGWMYHGNLVALLALVLSGLKRRTALAWSIRCSGMDLHFYSWTLRLVVWAGTVLSKCTDLLTTNSFEGMAVHRRMGYNAARRCVICNGINTDAFKPDPARRRQIRSELGIDEESVIVAHVARMDPMKDHETFLDAMRQLPSVYAFAIGEGTEGLPDVPNLKRWGRRLDVADLFASADIVVSSSAFGEGFSNAIAEGMACGLPAVATDVGDAREIVGDTGLIVPPRDSERMAEAIRDLASESRAAREARGLRARSRIVNRFGLRRAVDQFCATYSWLLNSKREPHKQQPVD